MFWKIQLQECIAIFAIVGCIWSAQWKDHQAADQVEITGFYSPKNIDPL